MTHETSYPIPVTVCMASFPQSMSSSKCPAANGKAVEAASLKHVTVSRSALRPKCTWEADIVSSSLEIL